MAGEDIYWLDQWMAEYEVRSVGEYRRAIQSPTALKSLYEMIPDHESDTNPGPTLGGIFCDGRSKFGSVRHLSSAVLHVLQKRA